MRRGGGGGKPAATTATTAAAGAGGAKAATAVVVESLEGAGRSRGDAAARRNPIQIVEGIKVVVVKTPR